MTEDQDYDVVLDTLQKQKDILWKMVESNSNIGLFNIMDQIRLEHIQEINEAIGMWLLWKEEKREATKCNGFCGEQECRENQDSCSRLNRAI
jgi:hypothetical protein